MSQIHYIFMINALLSQNLVFKIYALFLPIFTKSCLNIAYILDKYTQISYFVSKYAISSQIQYILMINTLLSQNLVVEIYTLFPPIFFGWQIVPAIFSAFGMYALFGFDPNFSNMSSLSKAQKCETVPAFSWIIIWARLQLVLPLECWR